jgi:catechol 2,3-dioxygenase-like lactoylglutathione lyase family enzyme
VKIIGAHAILYSKDAAADRAFLRDVLGFSHVDVGGGWLIFGLPPSEVAVHPGDEGVSQEFYLMVDDAKAFVAEMTRRGRATAPLTTQPYGVMTSVTLPSGHELGVYQPTHERPPAS